jgi:dCTP deaminase
MVLRRGEILSRLREFPVDSPQALVITPLIYDKESDVFDADSVDLRLGNYFLLPKTLDQPYFSPDRNSATSLHDRVHVPLGEFLVVPAHQTVLGATLEFIKLPSDVSGQVLTKSSVARTFIVVETAPWIHPQYRGCLTLEIANVSNTPVLLYPGRPICQLILMSLNPVNKRANQDAKRENEEGAEAEANYFGPVYPEAPKFRNPEDDLLGVGITRVSSLKRVDLMRSRKGWSAKLSGTLES